MSLLIDYATSDLPREKLLSQGASALSDIELLAIFLRTGVKGSNVLEVAQQLLNSFGNLRSLFAASLEEFSQHRGLGTAKYVQLQACIEMAQRYLRSKLAEKTSLTNPEDTRNYLTARLREAKKEIFACLLLNSQCQVIEYAELFQGTVNQTTVYPREVVKYALDHHATGVIIAHNHPSGSTKPSAADKELTIKLHTALKLFDITLLDHFIIGEERAYSFSEHGLLYSAKASIK